MCLEQTEKCCMENKIYYFATTRDEIYSIYFLQRGHLSVVMFWVFDYIFLIITSVDDLIFYSCDETFSFSEEITVPQARERNVKLREFAL